MRQTGSKFSKRSKGYIIGRSGFAKISAIEGIRTTDTMEADFRDFGREERFTNEQTDHHPGRQTRFRRHPH